MIAVHFFLNTACRNVRGNRPQYEQWNNTEQHGINNQFLLVVHPEPLKVHFETTTHAPTPGADTFKYSTLRLQFLPPLDRQVQAESVSFQDIVPLFDLQCEHTVRGCCSNSKSKNSDCGPTLKFYIFQI